jgi:excisionase family DNA binding protein
MDDERAAWLTATEAAANLRVHIETMRRWARDGTIPAAKLGNRGGFRIRKADLDRFLIDRVQSGDGR